MRRIIIVSNRLPVTVFEADDKTVKFTHSNGGLATALKSVLEKHSDPLWVGWPGIRRHLSKSELKTLSLPKHLCPVNLTDQQIDLYYDKFGNGVLWPVLHELEPSSDLTKPVVDTTMTVTKLFADQIEKILQPDDLIWIHDYHLLLLPAELRRRDITNRIGFFMHTPFFTPDTLAALTLSTAIKQSLGQVDLLGVQSRRDVVQTSICGLKAEHFPIGIDFDEFDQLTDEPEIMTAAKRLHDEYDGRQIIMSLSRLDYTKGIIMQLKVIKELSSRRQDFVYRLNVAPSRESVLEYRELRSEIEKLVLEINNQHEIHNWRPVIYTYENLTQQDISVLYLASDIQLNVPIKDGMNLVAKEHIAASRYPKVLILSDQAGAAEQLKEALLVNPKKQNEIVATLETALDMTPEEKARRWKKLRCNVRTQDVHGWSDAFIERLARI